MKKYEVEAIMVVGVKEEFKTKKEAQKRLEQYELDNPDIEFEIIEFFQPMPTCPQCLFDRLIIQENRTYTLYQCKKCKHIWRISNTGTSGLR